MNERELERFWAKVDKTIDCWIWRGSRHKQGYGLFGASGKTLRAHRVSYEIAKGLIPDGLHCLHSCDVTSCVNPDHLFLGTNADNMADKVADKVAKGRQAYNYGSIGGRANTDVRSVLQIRELYGSGYYTQSRLASIFSMSQANVNRIIRRLRWAHI